MIQDVISEGVYPDDKILPEHLIDTFYVVDCFVPHKNLIIEVQGPHHFNADGEMNKKTLTKLKVLGKLGYKIALINSIDFYKQPSEIMRANHVKQRIMRAK